MKTSIDHLFSDSIFPNFPFSDSSWIAVAFERDRYGEDRMPQAFFLSAAREFNSAGKTTLVVYGDGYTTSTKESPAIIPFALESYQNFMGLKEFFSLEYKMASDDFSCACWSDTELTVFGGLPDKMRHLINSMGGFEAVLEQTEKEFFLEDKVSNQDMRLYFRQLLYPEVRF